MYTITCARFDKNPLQNPSPDGTPARHRRDILLIVYYVLFSFERAFYTSFAKARLISGVTAALVGYRLSMLVTKCEACTAVAPRPRVTGDIGRLSRVDIR